MTENKKTWVVPELIVLVRSKPEEAVLDVCKQILSGPNYGSTYYGACWGPISYVDGVPQCPMCNLCATS